MTDVEVHIDLAGQTSHLGLMRRHPARHVETEAKALWQGLISSG